MITKRMVLAAILLFLASTSHAAFTYYCYADFDGDGFKEGRTRSCNVLNPSDCQASSHPECDHFFTDGPRPSYVTDNCSDLYNPDQIDFDNDGNGNACDPSEGDLNLNSNFKGGSTKVTAEDN